MKAAVTLLLLAALAVPAWAQSPPTRPERRTPEKAPSGKIDARAVLQAMEEAFSTVADRVTPAVVNVSTGSQRPAPRPAHHPPPLREVLGDPVFQPYFGRRPRDRP